MVDTNKLYKMIRVMGKMDLKSLIRRFPGETVESLRDIIENTDDLEIVGSFVRIKEKSSEDGDTGPRMSGARDSKNTVELSSTRTLYPEEELHSEKSHSLHEEEAEEEVIDEEEELEKEATEEIHVRNKIAATGESYYESQPSQSDSKKAYKDLKNLVSPISKNIKSVENENRTELRDVSKKKLNEVESEMSFDKLINLVNQYNQKIEEELDTMMSDTEARKKDAIYEYLRDRYTIEPYKKYDTTTILSQFDKTTNSTRGYAVITKDFTEDLFDLIDSLFDTDMVFIYYTNENCVEMLDTTKEFFLRPTEAIINQYMPDFEIKKVPLELSKIVKSGTEELIGIGS